MLAGGVKVGYGTNILVIDLVTAGLSSGFKIIFCCVQGLVGIKRISDFMIRSQHFMGLSYPSRGVMRALM